MFIGDYPNIHDGSLLYLVQLEGGSRMKVKFSGTDVVKLSRCHSLAVNKYCYQTSHFYVNHIKVRISVIITQTVVLFLAKIRTWPLSFSLSLLNLSSTWCARLGQQCKFSLLLEILRFYFLSLKVGDKELCQPTINAADWKFLQSMWQREFFSANI